jgi:hypothetical protein
MTKHACVWDLGQFSVTVVNTGENRMVQVQGSGTPTS